MSKSLRNVTLELLTDDSIDHITLWTSDPRQTDGEDPNEVRNKLGLRLFVSALERHPRVRSVDLNNCRFRLPDGDDIDPDYDYAYDCNGERVIDGWSAEPLRLRCQAVERLFCTVLPGHPSIREVQLSRTRVHPLLLTRFLAAVSDDRPLTRLEIGWRPLEAECVQALAAALRQNKAPVEHLSLRGCRLDPDGCLLLCEGVAHNRHVTALSLFEYDPIVLPECLRHVLGGTSSIRELEFSAHCLDEASVTELVPLLRTNCRLENLRLGGWDCSVDHMYKAFLDLVRTYNFTIRRLELCCVSREVSAALRRNERVRDDYRRAVEAADAERIERQGSGPEAIGRFGAFPTLIYRYLRWNGCAAAVALSSSQSSQEAVPLTGRRGAKRPSNADISCQ
jgi:hypothetical protein